MKYFLAFSVVCLVACGGSRFDGDSGARITEDSNFYQDASDSSRETDGSGGSDEFEDTPGFGSETDETGEVGAVEGTDEAETEETETEETETDEAVRVDPLIDDFEDGDERVFDADGRALTGRWMSRVKTLTDAGYVNPISEQSPVVAYSEGYAAHLAVTDLAGDQAEAWLAGFVSYSGRGYEPAATYDGIQFSACGVGSPVFRVLTNGGCGMVSYEIRIELTDEWQLYEIPWEALSEFWSPEAAAMDSDQRQALAESVGCAELPVLGESFDPSLFEGVQFEIDYFSGNTSLDLWVDDVAFLGGSVASIEGSVCP